MCVCVCYNFPARDVHVHCRSTRPEMVFTSLSSDTRFPSGVIARLPFTIILMSSGVQEELP